MAAILFPWPSKPERKARIEAARLAAEEAERQAGQARTLTEDLHRLRRRNHVSEAIDQMIVRKAREQR